LLFPLTYFVPVEDKGLKINFKPCDKQLFLLCESYVGAMVRYQQERDTLYKRSRAPREGPFFVRGALTSTDRRTRVGGASGCRWLVRLARCLASLPSSRKTVVSHSRILERFLANPNIRSCEATSCRSQPDSPRSLRPLRFCHRNSRTLKSSRSRYFRRISKRDEARFISLISQFLRHYCL